MDIFGIFFTFFFYLIFFLSFFPSNQGFQSFAGPIGPAINIWLARWGQLMISCYCWPDRASNKYLAGPIRPAIDPLHCKGSLTDPKGPARYLLLALLGQQKIEVLKTLEHQLAYTLYLTLHISL